MVRTPYPHPAYHKTRSGTERIFPQVVLSTHAIGKKNVDVGLELAKWVAARVANHKQLRGGVQFTDSIPKNPSGKILRRVLRERARLKKVMITAEAKL